MKKYLTLLATITLFANTAQANTSNPIVDNYASQMLNPLTNTYSIKKPIVGYSTDNKGQVSTYSIDPERYASQNMDNFITTTKAVSDLPEKILQDIQAQYRLDLQRIQEAHANNQQIALKLVKATLGPLNLGNW